MATHAHSTLASRRAFIGGVAAATIITTPVLAADRQIDALWTEHLRICAWRLEVDREWFRQGRSDDEFFDESSNAFFANYEAIQQLPFSPEAVAARVLIAANIEGLTYHRVEDQGALYQALLALRPVITGPVAETVSDYLDHPERPFAYGPLWGHEVEPGLSAIDLFLKVEGREGNA